MKFKCPTKILSDAISTVSRAAGPGSAVSIGAGVFISTHDDKVFLTCSNFEETIEVQIFATVSEQGSTVVNAKLIGDMVRRLSSDEISFTSDNEQKINIKSGKTDMDLVGINPHDFPASPEITAEQTIVIDAARLSELVHGTAFAASTSEARLVLTGCLLETDGELVRMVGLDGYRMAMREFSVNKKKSKKDTATEAKNIIIPAKALIDWTKIGGEPTTSTEEETATGETTLIVSHQNVAFERETQTGKLRFISRILSGEFMDFRKTIPAETISELTIDTAGFIHAIERVTTVIMSEAMRAPVKIALKPDGINLSCQTTVGKVDDFIATEVSGKELEIGFNHRFLLDALKNAGSKKVCLQFAAQTAPCLITPVDADKDASNFQYVVLPVRI